MEENSAFVVLLVVTAYLFSCSAHAENAPQPVTASSAVDHIRAARAKTVRDEATEPTTRPWDRDAQGKRPWEIKTDVPPKSQP